jgi:hypothetical protein
MITNERNSKQASTLFTRVNHYFLFRKKKMQIFRGFPLVPNGKKEQTHCRFWGVPFFESDSCKFKWTAPFWAGSLTEVLKSVSEFKKEKEK